MERYKRWTRVRSNNFEIDSKLHNQLVDLFPYLELRSQKDYKPPATSSSYNTEVVSLYSQGGGSVEASFSTVDTIEADTKFLNDAAKNLSMQLKEVTGPKGASLTDAHSEPFDNEIVEELTKYGIPCTFGSGSLSHNFHFKDVYGGRLDRIMPEPGVTTKQSGWSCVDYIYQR